MERRFETRLQEMLDQAKVSPEMLQDLLPRLQKFVEPLAESLLDPEQKQHAAGSITGLLSGLEHQTSEGVTYLLDQNRQEQQKFIGQVPWDHQPMLTTLASQVGQELGGPDGVIVFDPSGFAEIETKRQTLRIG